jgi:glycerate kinase
MRILLAPDKFKDSLGAEKVGARMAAALRRFCRRRKSKSPVAEGGEGTAEVIRPARRDEWRNFRRRLDPERTGQDCGVAGDARRELAHRLQVRFA